jgi:hypothetical protein
MLAVPGWQKRKDTLQMALATTGSQSLGHSLGHELQSARKYSIYNNLIYPMAEREGFEPLLQAVMASNLRYLNVP